MLRSRRLRVLLLLLALVLLAAVALGAGGRYDTFPQVKLRTTAARAAAPGWTRPCWRLARDFPGSSCARVTGRVFWVQRHDPDGDGDRHVLLISRLHVRIAKLRKESAIPVPRVGSRFTAVGMNKRGASGREEIDVQQAQS